MIDDRLPCLIAIDGSLASGCLLPGTDYRVIEIREHWEAADKDGERAISTVIRFDPVLAAAADRAEREGGELEHLRTAIANVRDISIGDLLVSWERQHGNYRVIEGGTLIEPPAADRAERGLPLDAEKLADALVHVFMRRHKFSANCDACWSGRELVRARLAADPQSPTGEGEG